MADAELRARASLQGGKETAEGLRDIGKAQGEVANQGEKGAKVAEEATKTQEKLNATTETYTTLASRLHPVMGAWVDVLVKGSRVVGDFATQQIEGRKLWDAATGAIRRNWNALKLFAAAGAAGAAIWLVVRAVNALKKANEEAEEQQRKNTDALNAQIEKTRELEKAYRDAAEARRRFQATSPEEQAAGTARARRLAKKYDIDEGTAVGIAGELAGVDVPDEMLAAYMGIRAAGKPGVGALSPYAGAESRRAAVEAATGKYADWWQSRQQAVGTGRERQREELVKQARASGGGTDALRAFIDQQFPEDIYPELGDEERKRLAELVQKFGGSQEEFERGTRQRLPIPFGFTDDFYAKGVDPGWLPGSRELVRMSPEEARHMDRLLAALETLVKNQNQPPVVQISPRNYGADAGAKRQRATNGQSKYGVGSDLRIG
jgi:hypothetical protein